MAAELKHLKNVNLRFPREQWAALRAEAARRGIPITELCLQGLAPLVDQAVQQHAPIHFTSSGAGRPGSLIDPCSPA